MNTSDHATAAADHAKIATEKAAHEAGESVKSTSAKVSEFASDTYEAAKVKGAELGAEVKSGASKAGDYIAQTYSEVAEQAKKATHAAVEKIETWTGKDLNGDGHVGAEKPQDKV